jgi:hypothetical protein
MDDQALTVYLWAAIALSAVLIPAMIAIPLIAAVRWLADR